MAERSLLLVGLIGLLVLAWLLLRVWRRVQLQQLARLRPLTAIAPLGRPAVVAFGAPECSDCQYRQHPALERLAAAVGETVTLRTLSAPEHPVLTSQIGILTVPATVVVDQRGRVRHLNLGFTGEGRLLEQLRGLD